MTVVFLLGSLALWADDSIPSLSPSPSLGERESTVAQEAVSSQDSAISTQDSAVSSQDSVVSSQD